MYSCVRSTRCPRDGTPALESSSTVPLQKSVELRYCLFRPVAHNSPFHIEHTGRNGTNDSEQPRSIPTVPNGVDFSQDTPPKSVRWHFLPQRSESHLPVPGTRSAKKKLILRTRCPTVAISGFFVVQRTKQQDVKTHAGRQKCQEPVIAGRRRLAKGVKPTVPQ